MFTRFLLIAVFTLFTIANAQILKVHSRGSTAPTSYSLNAIDSITFELGTVTDIDGNVYHTVTIGSQVWAIENLRTTKYNDGTPISHITTNTQWSTFTTGAYCYYDNNSANKAKYGALYNWHAVNTGKLAPAGWHVPTDAEWTTLENFLVANGYSYSGSMSGNKIGKSLAANTDWTTYGTAGCVGNDPTSNNSTGFSGLPGGYRNPGGVGAGGDGAFGYLSITGHWWSATEFNSTRAWYRYLYYDNSNLSLRNDLKGYGFSVRIVRDN